jgi:hypothetical protein
VGEGVCNRSGALTPRSIEKRDGGAKYKLSNAKPARDSDRMGWDNKCGVLRTE